MSGVVVQSMHALAGIAEIELCAELAAPLRRADALTKMATQCAFLALEQSSIPLAPQEDIGIFCGFSTGPLETNFRFLDSLLEDGEGSCSPTLFSHSVHNTTAGYLSRIFKIHGPVQSLTSFAWPFLTALREAALAIEAGVVKRAMVVTAEMSSPALDYALAKNDPQAEHGLCSGALCWLLEEASPAQGPQLTLQEISIQEKACSGRTLLLRQGEADTALLPLAHAFQLTNLLADKMGSGSVGPLHWHSETEFGAARLHFLVR